MALNRELELLSRIIAYAEVALDTATQLSASIIRVANVLLPSVFTTEIPQGQHKKLFPLYVLKSALRVPNGLCVRTARSQQAIKTIGSAASDIRQLNQTPVVDGTVRRESLWTNCFGKSVPSIRSLAVAKSFFLGPVGIKLNDRESVQISKLVIKTDESTLMQPRSIKAKTAGTRVRQIVSVT